MHSRNFINKKINWKKLQNVVFIVFKKWTILKLLKQYKLDLKVGVYTNCRLWVILSKFNKSWNFEKGA